MGRQSTQWLDRPRLRPGAARLEDVITGTHLVIYSCDAAADRAFLRDVLNWPHVAAGGPGDDWLIFELPPAEAGIHPAEEPGVQLFLTCDDLEATMGELAGRGVVFTGEPVSRSWGHVTSIRLPSGAEVGLYQPLHMTIRELQGR